jgi:mannose-6-phosphate isomerase
MKELYPLKFHPILKERIWGGNKLKEVLGKPSPGPYTAESWEISGVPGDVSTVSNGPLSGTSLEELINTYTSRLLGEKIYSRFGKEFPILIKFIDAKLDLSIQVHPGDDLARQRHNSFGKTEMWYVMDADEEAKLIIGFNKNVSREEYEKSIAGKTLLELLNYEPVNEGDTFLINNGKIHAIGAGIMLAEIQQTSDITYRVYDFDRRDQTGKLRELHTALALDAIDYRKADDFKVLYSRQPNTANTMVKSPYFKTNYLDLDRDYAIDVSSRDSFTIYIGVSGTASIANEAGKTLIKRGETILIPAETARIGIQTKGARFLEVTL